MTTVLVFGRPGARRLAIVVIAALCALLLPVGPARAQRLPRVLAASTPVSAAVVSPGFAVQYLGVTWTGAPGVARARVRTASGWTPWQELGEDGAQRPGEFATALLPANGASSYQVRVPAGRASAKAVAINVTDGPRTVVSATPADSASAATPTISRAGWGADESLRFRDGIETWPATYYPLQKMTVHHTATTNADPDPAATLRAIYRYHAVDRGWGDIGYQYLVDESGRVYEGRWSGSDGDPAHDAGGNVVTAAHVGGANSGNVGVALLGTLTSAGPAPAAQSSLESVLGDLSSRHKIDPNGSGTYVNPVNGSSRSMPNISGHRDWEATECPGDALYARLPQIRSNTAARTSPEPALTLTARGYKVKKAQKVELSWSGATTVDVYRDGVRIATAVGGTRFVDTITRTGRATYRYQVKSGSLVSNEATVSF